MLLSLRRRYPTASLVKESTVNSLGYLLLRPTTIKESIEVFRLNAELHPLSANVYDSLAEAYMKSGDKESAIKNYEKSLELAPSNDNAAAMLKRLPQR
jgi:Flp pilus assembly protein TadD